MTAAVVLIVEDNPITRKLVRFTLENQGLIVVEAPDGESASLAFTQHPIALVLQDLCLPDMDGFELLARLRKLPGGAESPILAFSGILSRSDEARMSAAGFDDLISKPIEPSRLIQVIRSHLPLSADARPGLVGQGRRIVVADDDPVQRKFVGFQMRKAGFDVVLAADGNEALEQARKSKPHAVLSDVLMPGLDGFGLCLALRRDPTLSKIPIVLTTNSYVEASDRELARKAGAHDLVLRTPELKEVLDALKASLIADGVFARVELGTGDLESEHKERMMRQLERQVALNAGVNQRCSLLSAEMSVLQGISEALASHEDIDDALRHALAACFDAGGVSLGAFYMKDETALRVLNFGYSKLWTDTDLVSFFGEPDLLDTAFAAPKSTLILAVSADGVEQRLLAKAGVAAALIVPVRHKGSTLGALVMLSKSDDLADADRINFAEAVGGQISQALAVAYAFREKERSERAAREQAAILQSVLESIGDGVGVVDGSGKLILWNSAARDIVEVTQRAGDQPAVPGRGVYGQDMVTPVPLDRLPLARAMRGELINGLELFVRHERAPDGLWFNANGRPWRDERGVARGGVVVFRDVTSEKSTQSHLMVSDRMASVGMLAAGVAHEINNPLACVLANLDFIRREFSERLAVGAVAHIPELRDMLEETRAAADRMRLIVRDLKVFSRHEDTAAGPVDVQKVIESSLRMAWNEIRHRARLVKDYGAAALVEGSESRLGQVFLNLIVNAAQAVPEGNAEAHTIRIVTRSESPEWVVIDISDTGSGISPENLRHLFQPFFTTKGPGAGTGLGLAICHRLVTDCGGSIRVKSETGKGTTFSVTLPVARSVEVVASQPAKTTARSVRRARILVVDDEPTIGAVVRRTLAKEHDVQTTVAGAEALEILRAGANFDVILCDLMMPQMTGMDLYAELLKLGGGHAERVIFLTGGAFTAAARAFLDEVPNLRVEKPFDIQHLRALVNDRVS